MKSVFSIFVLKETDSFNFQNISLSFTNLTNQIDKFNCFFIRKFVNGFQFS